MAAAITVGVLSLQGDFEKHAQAIQKLGANVAYVKKSSELEQLDALIFPGGESTALLRLIDDAMWQALFEHIQSGLPTLATCAGAILLATDVQNPAQRSLGLIDISIRRNAYGRQIDSFITDKIQLTPLGVERLKTVHPPSTEATTSGIFIRAPQITRCGPEVDTLAMLNEEAVLVQSGNILVATYHPELSESNSVHQLLLAIATKS